MFTGKLLVVPVFFFPFPFSFSFYFSGYFSRAPFSTPFKSIHRRFESSSANGVWLVEVYVRM